MLRIFSIGCCVIMFTQPAYADTLTRRFGKAMFMGAGVAAGSMAMRGAVGAISRPSAPAAVSAPAGQHNPGYQAGAPQGTGEAQNPFSR